MSDSHIRVLQLSELPPGTKKVVMVEGKAILLCHANGSLHAISNICSHADKPLDRGKIGQGWIACPAHGGRFRLATGEAINLPAVRPIPVYPVRVDGDWIEISVACEGSPA